MNTTDPLNTFAQIHFMFSIEIKKEDGFEKIILKDNNSLTVAAILPECGAILHAFEAEKNNERINVIDSYPSKKEFEEHAESGGFLGSKLSPFVCRLRNGSYHFAGKNYKIDGFYLKQHAIHGILYRKPFLVTAQNINDNLASVTMKYEYGAEDKGYPFYYDCIVTWQLEKQNLLTVVTECINKDTVAIPMQDGWHPYFKLGDQAGELQLQFQSKEILEFDDDLLPTKKLIQYDAFNSLKKIGDTSFDNCFTLNRKAAQPLCVLRNAGKKIQIEITPGISYPYLQIYIPPHRQSIAIENLSGAPDAFNNKMGVLILEPGNSVMFKTTYKIVLH